MIKYLNVTNFLMFLLFGLVLKSVAIQSMSIGEALVGAMLVGYCAYMKFLEHHAAKKIEIDFEARIKNLENKFAMMGLGKSMNQRQ